MQKIRFAGALFALLFMLLSSSQLYAAPFSERWKNAEPYGVLFNQYDPNFYTGFAPREQNKENITIFLGRGNQVRVRIVLSDDSINHYLEDQVARHDLYKEVIDKKVITLTTNKSWELYDEKIQEEKLPDLVARKAELSPDEWRQLNLDAIDSLNPGRLHHIQRDFSKMTVDFASSLKSAEAPKSLEDKLVLINDFFPYRIYLTDLKEEQDAAFTELISLAKADDNDAFAVKAEVFFKDITANLYAVNDDKLDFFEFTTVFPAGTYDATTGAG